MKYLILFRLKNKGVTTEKLLLPIEFDKAELFDFVLKFYESYYPPFEVESRNIEDIVDMVEQTAATSETKKGRYKDFLYKSEMVRLFEQKGKIRMYVKTNNNKIKDSILNYYQSLIDKGECPYIEMYNMLTDVYMLNNMSDALFEIALIECFYITDLTYKMIIDTINSVDSNYRKLMLIKNFVENFYHTDLTDEDVDLLEPWLIYKDDVLKLLKPEFLVDYSYLFNKYLTIQEKEYILDILINSNLTKEDFDMDEVKKIFKGIQKLDSLIFIKSLN